jgi:hypothetical protein
MPGQRVVPSEKWLNFAYQLSNAGLNSCLVVVIEVAVIVIGVQLIYDAVLSRRLGWLSAIAILS